MLISLVDYFYYIYIDQNITLYSINTPNYHQLERKEERREGGREGRRRGEGEEGKEERSY
jgi:hypothetical protein